MNSSATTGAPPNTHPPSATTTSAPSARRRQATPSTAPSAARIPRAARAANAAGSAQFRGWQWLCPACAKPCRIVYLPLPPINLLPDLPRLAQIIDIPRRLEGFACSRCHRIRLISRMDASAWNNIIANLTGGLLFGREVPRPAWFTADRKRPYKPQVNRPSPRRDQILRRLLNGWTLR